MTLSRIRTVVAPLVVLGTALACLVLVAPGAQAAWQGFARVHGGVVQACARPVDGGARFEVRVRLNNAGASHTHLGGASAPDGRSRNFRVAAGRVSGVKSLVVSRSALVTMGIGETTGEGLGDSYPARSMTRC